MHLIVVAEREMNGDDRKTSPFSRIIALPSIREGGGVIRIAVIRPSVCPSGPGS